MGIKEEILKVIKKPFGALIESEDEIRLILKRRLTKKEYKIFMAKVEGKNLEELKIKLNLSNERFNELLLNIEKKLNSNAIKEEIFSTN